MKAEKRIFDRDYWAGDVLHHVRTRNGGAARFDVHVRIGGGWLDPTLGRDDVAACEAFCAWMRQPGAATYMVAYDEAGELMGTVASNQRYEDWCESSLA